MISGFTVLFTLAYDTLIIFWVQIKFQSLAFADLIPHVMVKEKLRLASAIPGQSYRLFCFLSNFAALAFVPHAEPHGDLNDPAFGLKDLCLPIIWFKLTKIQQKLLH